MPSADFAQGQRAADAGMPVATGAETQSDQYTGLRPWTFAHHVPGDTRTPPAPGAIWIGSGDA